MSAPLLHVAQETIGHAVVVHASGEIDLLTAPTFQQHLARAAKQARPPHPVIADLTEVRFLASAGLAALMTANDECQANHTPLRIVATTPATVRALHVTGLDQVLDVLPSLEKSLA